MTYEEVLKLVDLSKLKRDYLKNPIKIKQKIVNLPTKEDLEYLYLDANLSLKEVACFLKICDVTLGKILNQFNIKKSKELEIEQKRRYCLKKYGFSHPNKSKEVRNKAKNTCLKKYGVENPFQDVNKIRQIKLKKYGVDSYSKTDEFKQKFKESCLKKYGTIHHMKSTDFKRKLSQINLEKTGFKHNWSNPESYNKSKQFWFKKYGVECPLLTEKARLNSNSKGAKEKSYQTKKKNNSFNKSKIEDEIFNILKSRFFDIKRQYKSVLYPFSCDFYIPEKDLYIEYQGTWTHGKEPFNYENEEHQGIVNKWKNKQTKFYDNALKVWTVSDPLKRKIAKENNLNWVEFFNKEQFIDWLEKFEV